MIYFKREVDSLLQSKDAVIEFLRSENLRLCKELETERRRADNAVDRLLNEAKIGGITPDVKRTATSRADEIIKSVQAAARVGQAIDIKEDSSAV